MAFSAAALLVVDPGFTCYFPRHNTGDLSNPSGLPGSRQPAGLVILAMLRAESCEFTRPTDSSIVFGGSPAARMTVGFGTHFCIVVEKTRSIATGRQFDLVAVWIFEKRNRIAAGAVLHWPRLAHNLDAFGAKLFAGLVNVRHTECDMSESVAEIVFVRIPIVGELDHGVGFF